MVEMIDNRLDLLFPEKELFAYSPFSLSELRDNIILFIIKDAYAEIEEKLSLRANRGNDNDDQRMRDSRYLAYAQHYRSLLYQRVEKQTGVKIPELLPDDISSMNEKLDGHRLTRMQYFELNTIADHPLFKAITYKRICDVKKISNDRFIEYMTDYDNFIASLTEKLDGDDEDVIFATIALFTLEWIYKVELFYSFAIEAEKAQSKILPIERLPLLCAIRPVPLPPDYIQRSYMESRYVLHRKQLIPCLFHYDDADWCEIILKFNEYMAAEYSIRTEIVSKWSMPEFFYTHFDKSQWANFFRNHYDIRTMYSQKEWTNKRIRTVRQIYEAMTIDQPHPSNG
jgi:hypothetical protein